MLEELAISVYLILNEGLILYVLDWDDGCVLTNGLFSAECEELV